MVNIAPSPGFEAWFEEETGFDTIDPWFLTPEAMSHLVGELNNSSPSVDSQMSDSVFLNPGQEIFDYEAIDRQVLADSNFAVFPIFTAPTVTFSLNYDATTNLTDNFMGYSEQQYPQGPAEIPVQALSLESNPSEIDI